MTSYSVIATLTAPGCPDLVLTGAPFTVNVGPPAYGTYRADATNTGPNGKYAKYPTPTLDNSDAGRVVTITKAGPPIIGKRYGRVVMAPGIVQTFYSCETVGVVGEKVGSVGTWDTNADGSGAILYDCGAAVQKGAEATSLNAFMGHDQTRYRCTGFGGTDIIRSFNTHNNGGAVNVLDYGGYYHDYCGWLNDPSQSGPSHNDIWQHEGGPNCGMWGSTLLGRIHPTLGDGAKWAAAKTRFSGAAWGGMTGNSCVQVGNEVAAIPLPGLTLDHCFIDGGYISLNLGNKGVGGTNHIALTSNRFGRDQGAQVSGGDGTATVYAKTGTVWISNTGNVYDDNGHPITIRSN